MVGARSLQSVSGSKAVVPCVAVALSVLLLAICLSACDDERSSDDACGDKTAASVDSGNADKGCNDDESGEPDSCTIDGDPLNRPASGPQPIAKPVIYLYPENDVEVCVSLSLDGEISCVYPALSAEDADATSGEWRVVAKTDGTLLDPKSGREYGYLFWEGEGDWTPELDQGFCVAGADTAEFLESALREQGLTDREAGDFITYWLPRMQDNPYNLIAFQGEVYDRTARLTVDPQPDTIIRVFMAWVRLDEPVVVEPQVLSAPARSGFTVVEWGGGEVEL